jgi:hypothetical protein
VRAVHFAHAAGAEECADLVWAEPCAGRQHAFSWKVRRRIMATLVLCSSDFSTGSDIGLVPFLALDGANVADARMTCERASTRLSSGARS